MYPQISGGSKTAERRLLGGYASEDADFRDQMDGKENTSTFARKHGCAIRLVRWLGNACVAVDDACNVKTRRLGAAGATETRPGDLGPMRATTL